MKWIASLFLATCLLFALPAHSITNASRFPVLLYHTINQSSCDYAGSDLIALEYDLEMLYQKGYTVVPLYWIVEWVRGNRDGSTLPPWIVGLSFDDGYNGDWVDGYPTVTCAPQKSAYKILAEFKNRHPELPYGSPHASSFVIGSPTARQMIAGSSVADWWWSAANSSGLMEIYNHSADHDHPSVVGPTTDSALNITVPVRGYNDLNHLPPGNFSRINTIAKATAWVTNSAQFISSKIGMWPDLFAYPYGAYNLLLRDNYFPNYDGEHFTFGAFATWLGSTSATYVSRGSHPFMLGRFTHSDPCCWNTFAGLMSIVEGSLRKDELATGSYYLGFLNRIADSGGYGWMIGQIRSARCNNPGSVHGTLDSLSATMVASAEFQARGLTNADFVSALYGALLRRPGDSGGIAFWTGQLNSGAMTRDYVRQEFIYSTEFYQNTVGPILNESCA